MCQLQCWCTASSHLLCVILPTFLGGTVLYHNQPINPLSRNENKENQQDEINVFISSILLGDGKHKSAGANKGDGPCREILSLGDQTSVVAEWLDGSTATGVKGNDPSDWIVLALYPDVALRKLQGVDAMLSSVLRRYALFYDHHSTQIQQEPQNEQCWNMQLFVPPKEEFDSAFQSILRRFQETLSSNNASSSSISSLEKRNKKSNKQSQQQQQNNAKKGKEKTVWHDGKGKLTKAALAELDMSKDVDKDNTVAAGEIREDARAIAEARVTYLPSEGEKPAWEEEDTVDDFDIKWDMDQSGEGEEPEEEQQSSGVRGFFSNLLSTNRPLTKSDLDPPLKQMQQLLTSKNVAPSTAQAICEVVERQLLGKKVGTLVGVKRAVRHALEDAVERILCPELGGIGGRAEIKRGKSVDVLRGVVEKRERGKGFLGGLGGGSKGGKPYTIVMIGINGELKEMTYIIALYR